MNGLEGLAGSASGIAIGAYLFSVVWHNNTAELGKTLKDEEGYVEFIVALLLLGALQKYGPAGKVTSALTAAAIIAMLIRFGSKTGLSENLALFASGQKSALDTLKGILGKE